MRIDVTNLQDQKVDLKEYLEQMNSVETRVEEALKVAYESDSNMKTVIEFMERYEPIYVQR